MYAVEGLLQEVFLNDIGVENQAARIGRYPHTNPLTTSPTPLGEERGRA